MNIISNKYYTTICVILIRRIIQVSKSLPIWWSAFSKVLISRDGSRSGPHLPRLICRTASAIWRKVRNRLHVNTSTQHVSKPLRISTHSDLEKNGNRRMNARWLNVNLLYFQVYCQTWPAIAYILHLNLCYYQFLEK